jgi:hypothetical protein
VFCTIIFSNLSVTYSISPFIFQTSLYITCGTKQYFIRLYGEHAIKGGRASTIKCWCMAAACSGLPCSFIHASARLLHLHHRPSRPSLILLSLITSRFTCSFRPGTWRWRFQFPPDDFRYIFSKKKVLVLQLILAKKCLHPNHDILCNCAPPRARQNTCGLLYCSVYGQLGST